MYNTLLFQNERPGVCSVHYSKESDAHLYGLEDVLANEEDADEENKEDAGDLVVEAIGEIVRRDGRVEDVLGELHDQVGVHPAAVCAREVRPDRLTVRALVPVRVPARAGLTVTVFLGLLRPGHSLGSVCSDVYKRIVLKLKRDSRCSTRPVS